MRLCGDSTSKCSDKKKSKSSSFLIVATTLAEIQRSRALESRSSGYRKRRHTVIRSVVGSVGGRSVVGSVGGRSVVGRKAHRFTFGGKRATTKRR